MFMDWTTYIVNMAILTKVIYRFNALLIKIPVAFFTEMEKLIFKYIRNCKGLWIAKTILKRINKIGRLTLPNFETYYSTAVIKTVWYWHKDSQKNRRGSLKTNPRIDGQLIFYKGAKTIQSGKDSFFNK